MTDQLPVSVPVDEIDRQRGVMTDPRGLDHDCDWSGWIAAIDAEDAANTHETGCRCQVCDPDWHNDQARFG